MHNNHEWYTTSEVIEAARRTMGGIDLDPASCEEANKLVKATRYFSRQEDGLIRDWSGRIWMNPPFGASDTRAFVSKLIRCYESGAVSQACCLIMITPDNKSSGAMHNRFPHCLPPNKVWFNLPGTERRRLRDAVVIYYLGQNTEAFAQNFSAIGAICAPVIAYRGFNLSMEDGWEASQAIR